MNMLPPKSRAWSNEAATPAVSLDTSAIIGAYRRWSGVYDAAFGLISAAGRTRAATMINALPGTDVLEVGVGTGLALPLYTSDKRVTGIDLSKEMLDKARARAAKLHLANVVGLHEIDAEDTPFDDHSFDIAVAMFVASVVPNPRRLLQEMRRIVRPGGNILFVNHFAAKDGPRWWCERALAPASRKIGWHPDFCIESMLSPQDLAAAHIEQIRPFGIFTLVTMPASPA